LKQPLTVKLDWSRLLGFDQVTRCTDSASVHYLAGPHLAKLGAKVGSKLSRDSGR